MTTHDALVEYQHKRHLLEMYLLVEALEEQELAGEEPSFERAIDTVVQWLKDVRQL